ncbi:SLC12A8 [Lepeophtheirus salmonis]|uniref:SLC12A8 n=1 Tax=Lepeophtheirus salmonis TaxID=72036 RepID=A0A7R8CLN4_LEPSM|nr:SLC12A8 [Lepeophtheirus salmonis]CAF2859789.1 SLC12A8 [Lepeophtheirus salmonis]
MHLSIFTIQPLVVKLQGFGGHPGQPQNALGAHRTQGHYGKVSGLGILLLLALYISSISSCLATLYGTPRVLQSIAAENMLPIMKSLAIGKGPNQVPFNALLVISGITLIFIGIGEINRLATLATLPFLITYGVIEYSYFALCMQFDLNQRRLAKYRSSGICSPPTFVTRKSDDEEGTGSSVVSEDGSNPSDKKTRNEEFEELLEKYNLDEIEEKTSDFHFTFLLSLNFILMFFIHWGYSLLSIAICILVWFYIGRAAPGVNPGIAAEFSFLTFIKNSANFLIFGKDAEEGTMDQIIVPPVAPSMKTKSSQLNDVNTDFANRSQYHQTSTVQTLKLND